MGRVRTNLSFEEYFWKGVDLNGKVVLDAGTGFGITTLEIAKRVSMQERKGRIISVDVNQSCFDLARKLLERHGLQDLVVFVKADLSDMPEIDSESIDVVISTRTMADVNRFPCRLLRTVKEFYRVLRRGGHVIISDECPRIKPLSEEEEVAVVRWQLAKAISHLIGRAHANEVSPEDLEFMMRVVGFKRCEWAVFKGETIPKRRIEHFIRRSKEMALKIGNEGLRKAFLRAIDEVGEMYKRKGGVFVPRYVIHAYKL